MPSSLHHLLNVHVQIANKLGNIKKIKNKFVNKKENGESLLAQT
jgi:hypothetical protein